MTFSDAYEILKTKGAMAIAFKAQGSDYIDVWASELMSGDRKGVPVIRIQWSRSQSTIDELEWRNNHEDMQSRQYSFAGSLQSAIENALRSA